MVGYKITAEIPLVLTYFSFMMVASVVLNLNMYKTCYNIMGYPDANCSRLGRYTDNATQELENIVQSKATYVTAITEMVPASVPVIFSLIITSWSDKYGRKPVMVYVLACLTIGFSSGAVMLLFKEISPYTMMIGAISTIVCGGPLTFFTVTLAYLNDIATPEDRAIRNAVYEVIVIFSTCFGALISTPLLYATSYSAVYALGGLLIGSATVYTYFFIPESLKNRSTDKPSISNVFTCQNLTGMFVVAGKKRPYNKRAIILMIISTIVILNFVATGEGNIKTNYLRKVLSWTLTQRNVFSSWSSVVGILGTIALTFILYTKLKIKDTILMLIGTISLNAVSILYGIAKSNWYIYVSVPVGILSGPLNPLLRTKLAQCLPSGEMGKIFGLINVINSISLLVSSLVFASIYTSTKDTHPETFNWFSMGMVEICMVLIIALMIVEARQPPEAKLISSAQEEEHQQENKVPPEESLEKTDF